MDRHLLHIQTQLSQLSNLIQEDTPPLKIVHLMKLSPISIKQTTASHLNPLNTKKTMTYSIENPSSGLGQAQKRILSMLR